MPRAKRRGGGWEDNALRGGASQKQIDEAQRDAWMNYRKTAGSGLRRVVKHKRKRKLKMDRKNVLRRRRYAAKKRKR